MVQFLGKQIIGLTIIVNLLLIGLIYQDDSLIVDNEVNLEHGKRKLI